MNIIDLFLHLDQHLLALIIYLGPWFYALMIFVIFAETGLIVTPFLPGDSLLFALGALAAISGGQGLDVWILGVTLTLAAVAGNFVNYKVGHLFGEKILEKKKIPFVKPQHIESTKDFFGRYGNRTIFLARFAPILRTIAPFIAGVGQMKPSVFHLYNWLGALVWVPVFLGLGYFFGNLPWVKQQFHWVTIAIVIISLIPVALTFLQNRASSNLK